MRRLPAHACISRSRGGSSYCERAAAALSPLSSGGRSAAPAAVRCSGDAGERADTRKSIKTCETASCREGGRLCSAHVHFVFYQLTRRKASSTGRAGRAPPARRAARRPTPGRRRQPPPTARTAQRTDCLFGRHGLWPSLHSGSHRASGPPGSAVGAVALAGPSGAIRLHR